MLTVTTYTYGKPVNNSGRGLRPGYRAADFRQNLAKASPVNLEVAHRNHTYRVYVGSAVNVGETGQKVAFAASEEVNVRFYRFASELTAFPSGPDKLWHNRRSFARRAPASGGTRSDGTVPVKQNLIQGRRRSFTVPVASAAAVKTLDSRRFFAAAAHSRSSDH
ncbi:hypothetical protein [Burkholderia sp. SRS-W-2-2016]|uniref:hypothetical protein n=1 Tax=Burkholderia sp. SRS-W-2-2016 TaxID=1926878 RepID=UPI00118109DD|nr:hypothetical protein [Burkholderia sp. SRS-W-2-2016]